jgi:hypothetical protein
MLVPTAYPKWKVSAMSGNDARTLLTSIFGNIPIVGSQTGNSLLTASALLSSLLLTVSSTVSLNIRIFPYFLL